MLVQVNDLFVGQVDILDKGIKISELDPNEDYDIRIWCQIENGKFYPSRKIKICTDSYRKVVEDDVLSSATTQVYSEFEMKSLQESFRTTETESITRKDSRLKALRLQVESLKNVCNSIQKNYKDKKSGYLSSINKAKTHYESLNLSRPNLLRSLKTLEGNKKIIAHQKSLVEKELLAEKTRFQRLKQDFSSKNEMKSTLNREIRLMSITLNNSKKKNEESVQSFHVVQEEYASEIKDLEEAVCKRKHYLEGLEERISTLKERISFMKHLLRQLCKAKAKSRADWDADEETAVETDDALETADTEEEDFQRAWVDQLTD